MKGYFEKFSAGGKSLQESLTKLATQLPAAPKLATALSTTKQGAGGPSGSFASRSDSIPPEGLPRTSLSGGSHTKDDIGRLHERLAALQVKHAALQSELEEVRAGSEEAAVLKGRVKELEIKLLFALKGQEGIEPLIPQVVAGQQEQICQLMQDVAQRDTQLAVTRSECQVLRHDLEATTTTASDAQQQAAVLEAKLTASRQQIILMDTEIEHMRAAVAAASSLSHPDAQVSNAGSPDAQLQADLAAALQTIAQLQQQLDDSSNKGQALASSRDPVSHEVQALTAQLTGLQALLDSNAEQLQAAQAREQQLLQQVTRLQAEQQEQGAAAPCASQEKDAAGESAQEQQLAALQAQVAELKQLTDSLQVELAQERQALDAQRSTANAQLATSESACEQLSRQLEELNSQLQAAASAASLSVSSTSAKSDDQTAAVAEALHRAEEAEQRCAEVRAELKVTVNKLESATARIVLLTEKEHEADAILAQYSQLEEALAAAQEATEEAQAELARTTAQAEQAHESYAKLRSKLDIYSVRKQELEAHCAVLEQRAAQADNAEAQLLTLKTELATLQAAHQQLQEHRGAQPSIAVPGASSAPAIDMLGGPAAPLAAVSESSATGGTDGLDATSTGANGTAAAMDPLDFGDSPVGSGMLGAESAVGTGPTGADALLDGGGWDSMELDLSIIPAAEEALQQHSTPAMALTPLSQSSVAGTQTAAVARADAAHVDATVQTAAENGINSDSQVTAGMSGLGAEAQTPAGPVLANDEARSQQQVPSADASAQMAGPEQTSMCTDTTCLAWGQEGATETALSMADGSTQAQSSEVAQAYTGEAARSGMSATDLKALQESVASLSAELGLLQATMELMTQQLAAKDAELAQLTASSKGPGNADALNSSTTAYQAEVLALQGTVSALMSRMSGVVPVDGHRTQCDTLQGHGPAAISTISIECDASLPSALHELHVMAGTVHALLDQMQHTSAPPNNQNAAGLAACAPRPLAVAKEVVGVHIAQDAMDCTAAAALPPSASSTPTASPRTVGAVASIPNSGRTSLDLSAADTPKSTAHPHTSASANELTPKRVSMEDLRQDNVHVASGFLPAPLLRQRSIGSAGSSSGGVGAATPSKGAANTPGHGLMSASRLRSLTGRAGGGSSETRRASSTGGDDDDMPTPAELIKIWGQYASLQRQHTKLQAKHEELITQHQALQGAHTELEVAREGLLAQGMGLSQQRGHLDQQLLTLRDDHTALQEEYVQLGQQHAELSAAHEALLAAKAALDAQHEALQASQQQLRADHAGIIQQKNAVQQRCVALEASQSSVDAELAEACAVYDRLKAEHVLLTASRDGLQLAFTAAQAAAEEAGSSTQQLQQECARASQELDGVAAERAEAEAALQALRSEAEGLQVALEASGAELKQVKAGRAEALSGRAAADTQLEVVRNERDALLSTSQHLRDQFDELRQQQLASAVEQAAAYASLQAEHEGLQAQHSIVQQSLAQLQTAHDALAASAEGASAIQQQLHDQLVGLQHEHEQLLQQHAALVQELEQLQQQHAHTEEGRGHASAARDAAGAALPALQNEAEVIRMEHDALKVQLEVSTSEHAQLQAMHGKLQSICTQAEARHATVAGALDALRMEHDALQAESTQLRERLEEHQRQQMPRADEQAAEHTYLQEEHERLQAKHGHAQEELVRLQEVQHARSAGAAEATATLRQLQEEHSTLSQEHAHLKEAHAALMQVHGQLQAQLLQLEASQQFASERVRQLEEDLAAAAQALYAAQRQAQSSDELVQQLQCQLEAATAETIALCSGTDACQLLSEQVASLTAELDSLKLHVHALEAERGSLVKRVETMQEELHTERTSAMDASAMQQRELADARARYDSLWETHEALAGRHREAQDAELAHGEAQAAERTALHARCEELAGQVALLEADRLALQASAQESLTALAAQHAAAAASEEELRVVHDALLSEHGELQEEMERMLQELSGMEQRCAEAAAFASSASAVRGQLEAQLLRSDDACAEAEARAEALRQEMEQMQAAIDQLKEEFEQAKSAARMSVQAIGLVPAPAPPHSASAVHPAYMELMRQMSASAALLQPFFSGYKTASAEVQTLAGLVTHMEALAEQLQAAVEVVGQAHSSQQQVQEPAHGAADEALANAGDAEGLARVDSAPPPSYEDALHSEDAPYEPGHEDELLPSTSRVSVSPEEVLMHKVSELEAQVRGSELAAAVVQNVVDSMRAEVAELRAELAQVHQVSVPRAEVNVLEDAHRLQVAQLEASLQKIAERYRVAMGRLEQDNSGQLSAMDAEHRAALDSMRQELTTTKAALSKAEERARIGEHAANESHIRAREVEAEWCERVEQLQASSKRAAADMEDLQAQYAASVSRMQQADAEAKELQKRLDAEQRSAAELGASLSAAQRSVAELAVVRQSLQDTQAALAAAQDSNTRLESELSDARVRLQATEADRQRMAGSVVELHELRAERMGLERRLTDAITALSELEALRPRLEAAEADRERCNGDASRLGIMLGNVESRLTQLEEENEQLLSALDEEKRRSTAMARNWATELETLPGLPRDRWPASVRRLVDSLGATSGGAGGLWHGSSSSRRSSASGAQTDGHHGEGVSVEALRLAKEAAEVQLHDVQREMSYTRSELASANAAMVAQRAQAAEDTRTAAAQHAAAMNVLRASLAQEVLSVQEQLQAAQAELQKQSQTSTDLLDQLSALREKSRSLLGEKDGQIDTLKAQLRQARGGAPATPSGSSTVTGQQRAGSTLRRAAEPEAPLQTTWQGLGQGSSSTARVLTASSSSGSLGSGGADAATTGRNSASGQASALSVPALPPLPPAPPPGFESEAEEAAYWRAAGPALAQAASMLRHLHATASACLADETQLRCEVSRLEVMVNTASVEMQYLRGVIVSGYQNGTMPHDTPLFPVLARLLKFTDAEVDAINQAKMKTQTQTARGGVSMSLMSLLPGGMGSSHDTPRTPNKR